MSESQQAKCVLIELDTDFSQLPLSGLFRLSWRDLLASFRSFLLGRNKELTVGIAAGWLLYRAASYEPRVEVQGKRILVAGAGSAIGSSLSRALLRKGAHVILVGPDEAPLLRVQAEARAEPFRGGNSAHLVCDLSDGEAVAKLSQGLSSLPLPPGPGECSAVPDIVVFCHPTPAAGYPGAASAEERGLKPLPLLGEEAGSVVGAYEAGVVSGAMVARAFLTLMASKKNGGSLAFVMPGSGGETVSSRSSWHGLRGLVRALQSDARGSPVRVQEILLQEEKEGEQQGAAGGGVKPLRRWGRDDEAEWIIEAIQSRRPSAVHHPKGTLGRLFDWMATVFTLARRRTAALTPQLPAPPSASPSTASAASGPSAAAAPTVAQRVVPAPSPAPAPASAAGPASKASPAPSVAPAGAANPAPAAAAVTESGQSAPAPKSVPAAAARSAATPPAAAAAAAPAPAPGPAAGGSAAAEGAGAGAGASSPAAAGAKDMGKGAAGAESGSRGPAVAATISKFGGSTAAAAAVGPNREAPPPPSVTRPSDIAAMGRAASKAPAAAGGGFVPKGRDSLSGGGDLEPPAGAGAGEAPGSGSGGSGGGGGSRRSLLTSPQGKSSVAGEVPKAGVGIELSKEYSGLQVVVVHPNSPAFGKLNQGDVIVAVDSRTVEGKSCEEALDLIQGPTGSEVVISVRSSGPNAVQRRVRLVRGSARDMAWIARDKS